MIHLQKNIIGINMMKAIPLLSALLPAPALLKTVKAGIGLPPGEEVLIRLIRFQESSGHSKCMKEIIQSV